jgi:hypothetical protein
MRHSGRASESSTRPPMCGAAERSLGAALDGRRSEANAGDEDLGAERGGGSRAVTRRKRRFLRPRVDVEQVSQPPVLAGARALARGGAARRPSRSNRASPTGASASFVELEQALRAGAFRRRPASAEPRWSASQKAASCRLAEELASAVIVDATARRGPPAPLLSPCTEPGGPSSRSRTFGIRDLGARHSPSGCWSTLGSTSRSPRPRVRSAPSRTRRSRRAPLVRPGRARLRRALGALL